MENKLHYEQAFEQLTQLTNALEQGIVPLHELATYAKQAKQLLKICETRLKDTEKALDAFIDD